MSAPTATITVLDLGEDHDALRFQWTVAADDEEFGGAEATEPLALSAAQMAAAARGLDVEASE